MASSDQSEKNFQSGGDERSPETACFGFLKIPADQKVNLVRLHFNTVVRRYDFLNTLFSFGIHHLWKRKTVKMLRLDPGDRVLDVCGGTADLALLAAKRMGPGGRVMLYDINWAMMGMGRFKAVRAALADRIQFIQGDAERIAFADNTFDAAMVGFGIRNVTHMEEGFREMHRVLKPGGKFACLEFSRPTAPLFRWLYDFYSFNIMPFVGKVLGGSREAYTYLPESIRTFPMPDELSSMLEKIGFARVKFRRLTNGIAVLHSAQKI